MGRRNFYKPGSYYVIDDRSGFAVPIERARMEWNGLLVREQSWEPRQPQDFVRGTVDQQSVPIARPRTPPQFVPTGISPVVDIFNTAIGGDFTTDFNSDFDIGSLVTCIQVQNQSGWLTGDIIWIMQNNGVFFRATIVAIGPVTTGSGSQSASPYVTVMPQVIQEVAAQNPVVNMALQARIAANLYPGMIGNFTIGRDSIGVNSLSEFGPQLEDYDTIAVLDQVEDFSR